MRTGDLESHAAEIIRQYPYSCSRDLAAEYGCSHQAIVITPRLALKKEVHMYPYKSRTSRLLARFFKFLYGRGKRD